MNNNGRINNLLALWIVMVFSVSCNPIHRFNRLVERYPYLLDTQKYEQIVVDTGGVLDTIFISQTEFDTIYLEGGRVRIERFRDTFRIQYRERNCTTTINKTEIRPSEKTERTVLKERKLDFWIKAIMVYLAIITFLILIKK
jgi:hypothetical protein